MKYIRMPHISTAENLWSNLYTLQNMKIHIIKAEKVHSRYSVVRVP